MTQPKRKSCVSHSQPCQGQEAPWPLLMPLLVRSKKH